MAGPNMDQFETYFKRADLDGDGRISGAEAVSFFQGSNLSKQVLAQIWMHADQRKTGFLDQTEFFNALRLVTVAQSKRELTPDIVKAALYGPAAAKIPAPQINLLAIPALQSNSMSITSAPQTRLGAPAASQNFGFRGPGAPNAGVNQNYFPLQNQSVRPPQTMPTGTGTATRPLQAMPNVAASHLPQTMPSGTASRPLQAMATDTASHLSQAMLTGTGSHPPQAMFTGTGSHPPQAMPIVSASYPPQPIPSGIASHPQQAMPTGSASRPPQGISGGMMTSNFLGSNVSNDWLGARTRAPPSGSIGINPSMPSSAPKPQATVSTSALSTANDSKALTISGNGFSSTSGFGNDLFSTKSSPAKEPSNLTYSASVASASPAIVPVSSGSQPSSKSMSLDMVLNGFSMQPAGTQFQQPQLPLNPSQQVSTLGSSSSISSGGIPSVGTGSSTSDTSQLSWPKMKPADVQKYSKVFMEVDTDRDGKITGEQARNLFLSWRLPREVLKQVWDLSDQDSDSMLSLREFCFALYLMERYREGRPLPSDLPSNVLFDETLIRMTGQPKVTYGNAAWGPSPGFGQQQGMQGAQPMPSAPHMRPPLQGSVPKPDGVLQPNQQKPSVLLEDSFLNQRENGEHNSAITKPQAPSVAGQKVEEKENVILDSREKLEFYRAKMQDLVLYKSRCDNKLNEITERASADKHEVEFLGKKYEEKYKQVAEISSKLTIEEARFRDIQERKMELNQAIVRMEQGGSADGILQVRADRIQYDLEELVKVLSERCKKDGLNPKSTAIIELPIGWEPGIQDGAAVWDEGWDKFEDEGFANDLTFDAKNASLSPSQSTSVQRGMPLPDHNSSPDSPLFADERPGYTVSASEHAHESESAFSQSEDEYAKSPRDSPAGRTAVDSPSQVFPDSQYEKSFEADTETHRSFDESTWGGAFDTNDDVDSVWGFNTVKTKDSDSEKHRDLFGSSDFGVDPIKTGSPYADTSFQRKSPFFEDSVPSTPMSKFNNSPRYSEAGDFDNFSRFDSFSMHDSGFSQQPDRFTRFDSISSSRDFNHLSRFDSINSSRDYGASAFSRFDSINSSRDVGNNRDRHTRFDSISSTADLGHSSTAFSFDESDPFGSSGPFKVSSESQTTQKGSDNWSAF